LGNASAIRDPGDWVVTLSPVSWVPDSKARKTVAHATGSPNFRDDSDAMY